MLSVDWIINSVFIQFLKQTTCKCFIRSEEWISLKRPSWTWQRPLAPVCLQPFTVADCTAYKSTRWHRHLWKKWPHTLSHWWIDKGIQAFPWAKKTQASKELSPGLEALWARCEGPRVGPDPSQADQENPHITEGALTGHRHLQGFGKTEWKSKEKGKTRDVVECWESCRNYHLQWRQRSRELRLGTCSCKLHADWCARVPFSSPKDP